MQANETLVVEVNEQTASAGAKKGCRRRRRLVAQVLVSEAFAVKVCTKLTQRLATPVLFQSVPGQNGGLEDAPLVAYLLVQRDVTRFNAGHDVRA